MKPAAVLAPPEARRPALSVVIPVYGEEAVLARLFERLYRVLDRLGTDYEVVFVDDGSLDRSPALLAAQHARRPDVTRVVLLGGNFGQHPAVLAGFAYSRGECVITLDADLQNAPEDIPALLAAVAAGHDYVGTIRSRRLDSAWRRFASRAMNRIRERLTHIRMTDQGCMLRAYHRRIVDQINACREMNTFVPALGYCFAQRPTEITVTHAAREDGASKYSLWRLVQLNYDLMTGFSTVPLQWFSWLGMAVSLLSGLLVVVLAVRRLWIGPEEGGLFTLFGIAFFMIGLALFGIGLLGEYVGRIYQEVRGRPRYVVAAVLETEPRGTGA